MKRIDNIPKRVTPHTARRTSSTNAYLNGMSLEDIRGWLRHADIRTTEIYVRNSTNHIHGEHRRFVH